MRPVRRRVRRHFGLTAKRVAIRTQRPWYFQALLAGLFVLLGFGVAYWILRGGENLDLKQRLDLSIQENKALEAKLVGAQRELQVELATNNNLAKQLSSVQDENIKIKEDLFFYKNMLGKQPK